MTAADIYVALREMREVVLDKWILNIYQLNGTLLFKISQESPNKIWLLIEPGRRIHLTSFVYEKEAQQRAFCRALRQHLRNHKITALEQHDFDRVVYLRAGPPESQYTLVVELFGGGNAILLDPENRIVSAMTYKRMRDRDIIRGTQFKFPPLRGRDPINVSQQKLEDVISGSDQDITRTLIRGFNISGDTAEEIVSRAGLDPKTSANTLNTEQISTLHHAMANYFEILSSGSLSPCIVMDETGNPYQVLPLASPRYQKLEAKRFPTFNEALDAYFSALHGEKKVDTLEEEYQREIAKLEDLRERQKQHLTELEERATRSRAAATAIYQNLPVVEELLTTIRDARQRGVSWPEIQKRLTLGKQKHIAAAMIVEQIDPKGGRIHVNLNGLPISLDVRLSGAENANRLFQRSKSLEKKAAGARKAIEETERKLASLQERREKVLVRVQKPLQRRRRKWFEKFRWSMTSRGLLILGGRDATSNQVLVRRYLEESDLFFHADVTGAPVVILKGGDEEGKEEDLLEAAIFAVSYSRAWKTGWSVCDAYWVRRNQVSLSPPSGEYLRRGAVMVRGERNYIRGVPLRIAVGLLVDDEGFPFVAAGPETALRHQTEMYVTLVPGTMKTSEVAKRVRELFARMAPAKLKDNILAINLDEIIAVLPPGPADFEKKT